MIVRPYFVGVLASLCVVAAGPALGQTTAPTRIALELAAQDLGTALLAVAKASGRQILFASELVAGKKSPRLTGKHTAIEALRRLLQASGLTVRDEAGALIVVRGVEPVADAGEVIVTGSRIRSAQRYSPVTTLDRRALRAQGQNDLGQAIRATVPQNFGGGQSPVIGLGAEDYGSDNITSGSAINLRGLGPDATLTLLNGRRFAYDGVAEGVDVASIPLAAVERIEIVADGASAIYGSDAVAGVANVVLRRDFSGLETSARLGTATSGGDAQRQLEAVAGTVWSTGGLVATASYNRNSAILAGQRSFARTIDPSTTLLPRQSQIGAVLSGHQALGDKFEFDLDLLYSRRVSFSTFSATTTASYLDGGISRHLRPKSFVASPSLKVILGPSWSATLNGNYASDRLDYRTSFFGGGVVTTAYRGSYANKSFGGELSAEGPLVAIGGGDIRLATGGGYRRVTLTGAQAIDPLPPTTILHGGRESLYAFGELNAPLVGNANRRTGIERLSFNAAGRFEHYPHIGNVFTPKVGLLYAPARIVEVRGSWGRSFKAPTLFQLFQDTGAYALPASEFGGANDPAANAIFVYGGNPDLRPQRAETWSAGTVLTPFADDWLRIEASYFQIRYSGRIVPPITAGSTALSNPAVAELVTLNPAPATVSALVASLQSPFQYYGNGPYDPATITAIIDNRNRNVAAERYSGIDASANWRLPLSSAATLTLTASSTYLTSRRQVSRGQAEVPLAGHIFQPPHVRGRGGATLVAGGLTASAFLTLAGGVTDDRYAPVVHVDGQRSVDLALGYAFTAPSGLLHGLSLQATLLNAFNDQPERIRNRFGYLTPFDATNYDPVGRFVGVRVAKQW